MAKPSEDKVTRHPSYAVISINRTTGRMRLFGSSVDHHSYITLEIRRAKHIRGLHHDRVFPTSGQLIEVALSPAQFSEMITNMNVREGTPCTLVRVMEGGKLVGVEPPQEPTTTTETYLDEFRERMAKLAKYMRDLQKDAANLAEKASANKTERRSLAEKIGFVVQELASNMPFVLESYLEQIEKVKSEAKAEIEAFQAVIKGEKQRPRLEVKTKENEDDSD